MNKILKQSLLPLVQLAVAVALIAAGAYGYNCLKNSKPKMEKRKRPVTVPIVRVVTVRSGDQSVHIQGEGTVRPLREIQLVSQVGGKVVEISQALVNGGSFKKGQVLVRIDPEDYLLAVTLAKAKVRDSESKLQLVTQEAAVARQEWRIYDLLDQEPPPLVAKEPQLAAARARLEADRANLQKALLQLGRTELAAPFDGRVSAKNVDVGQYVLPGQVLATLYSTEAVEISVPLEDEKLFWFDVPGFTTGNGKGSLAKVNARIAGRDLSWDGQVVRSEGKLDERTRMVNVVVRVHKPYSTLPPLAPGLFVNVDIQGHTLKDAIQIPRSALREGNVVWVVDSEGILSFRKVDVARVSRDRVLVVDGLADGESVVVSPLKAATDGMKVRVTRPEEGNRS